MQEQDMNATGMNEPGARESTPVFIKSEDLEIRESKKITPVLMNFLQSGQDFSPL